MKTFVVATAIGAAMLGSATSANAASTVYLSSNFQAVTITVNGKGVSVDGGYDPTPVSVASDRVTLSAQAKANIGGGVCGAFSGWSDGNGSRTRTVNLANGNHFHAYYTRVSC